MLAQLFVLKKKPEENCNVSCKPCACIIFRKHGWIARQFVSASIYVKNPAVANKKISELNFRNKYNVLVTMIKRDKHSYIPEGDFEIKLDDLITLIGQIEDIIQVIEICAMNEK